MKKRSVEEPWCENRWISKRCLGLQLFVCTHGVDWRKLHSLEQYLEDTKRYAYSSVLLVPPCKHFSAHINKPHCRSVGCANVLCNILIWRWMNSNEVNDLDYFQGQGSSNKYLCIITFICTREHTGIVQPSWILFLDKIVKHAAGRWKWE